MEEEEEEDDEDEDEAEEEVERQTIRSERTLTEPAPRTLHVWEADRQALECRRCARRFNFLVRRHHCRRCGLVVCDRCSGHRIRLPFEHIIQDPVTDPSHQALIAMYPQRVCDACVRPIAKNIIPPLSRYEQSPVVASPMQRSKSAQSLMAECPVCGANFMGVRQNEQEHHLQKCLNTGSPPVRLVRYVVYQLSSSSTQLDDECPICFEEFKTGDKIARMICLCSYHQHCLSDWLARGKGCPVHYDGSSTAIQD
ncbi:hypothetical protein PHYBLDRAFT_110566 [Phycomyces blakesleeanus NRRL 1555(-)]|uniref:RING-type E3 ubiquitin transferase n=2 Tax=Phycomyces blakesleeanus TaxID=4837 RepID=A0A162UKZ7_PHYB8|nr:hypothetical protein PHYBLDRAFT_110566 [Phycomyces blakesleeanus NRRL 1555(-)]OAD76043.1 hypothetical protein PHYBLDRAFT_110566 [Phycomyces blakesleeanus NRRL 1555(-)]|eukprot:XP_018294083.1 hypothetical protein PHYBLDRAFT_110566 [Phycomyces blakesleeanus NRRL 1555(-)]